MVYVSSLVHEPPFTLLWVVSPLWASLTVSASGWAGVKPNNVVLAAEMLTSLWARVQVKSQVSELESKSSLKSLYYNKSLVIISVASHTATHPGCLEHCIAIYKEFKACNMLFWLLYLLAYSISFDFGILKSNVCKQAIATWQNTKNALLLS